MHSSHPPRFVSRNRALAALFFAGSPNPPTLARRSSPTPQPLKPSVSITTHTPPTQIKCHPPIVSQNRAIVAQFCAGSQYPPTLMHRSFPTSQPLNPDVRLTDKIPSTQLKCHPLIITQNRAPVARFSAGGQIHPILAHRSIAHPHHLDRALPHPKRIPSTQLTPRHLSCHVTPSRQPLAPPHPFLLPRATAKPDQLISFARPRGY